jgi:hypothetical protein
LNFGGSSDSFGNRDETLAFDVRVDRHWPRLAAQTRTYVTGVVVLMADVTIGIDKKLEQNAVAADRDAMSVGLVPVGFRHLPKLSLQAARANS